jgi:hypothetical protein
VFSNLCFTLQRSFISGDVVAVLAAEEFWLFRLQQPASARDDVLSGDWLVQYLRGSEGSSWKLSLLGPDVVGRQNVLADVSSFLTKKRDESFLLLDKAHRLLADRVRWEHEDESREPTRVKSKIVSDESLRKLVTMCQIVPPLVSSLVHANCIHLNMNITIYAAECCAFLLHS